MKKHTYSENLKATLTGEVNKAAKQIILADRSNKAKGKHFAKLVMYKNRATGSIYNKEVLAILKGKK